MGSVTNPDPTTRLEFARRRTEDRIRELTKAFDEIVASSKDANLDDEHDPEGSTVGFERAQTSALLDAARAQLAEIEAAEQRNRTDTYGICERCGVPIRYERLEAQPATKTCVACANKQGPTRPTR
jgi:DnaK suppressor protein